MAETEGDDATEGYDPTDANTETVEVSLYVPAYQLDTWDEHADELGMNRSEFVRLMVQGGRRDFTLPADPKGAGGEDTTADDVVALLDEHGELEHSEIVEHLVATIEADVDSALVELQKANEIRYAREGFVTIDE